MRRWHMAILDNVQLDARLLHFVLQCVYLHSPYMFQVLYAHHLCTICAPDGHFPRVTIKDAASIKFHPPDDGHIMLETCRIM